MGWKQQLALQIAHVSIIVIIIINILVIIIIIIIINIIVIVIVIVIFTAIGYCYILYQKFIWRFPLMGIQKWMVYNGTSYKMDDLRVPPFWETFICVYFFKPDLEW